MALIFDIILYMQLNLLEPMNVLKVRSLALAMFCACLSVPVAGQLRQQSFLSEKWDFRLDRDEAEDVWEQVDVPHTWNAKDGTSPDYYRGDGTYRYTLSISPAMMKKRIFLRFEAASQKAEVKVNGREVGEHVGGFNAFCFEITPYVHAGENLLEVTVSNRKELNIAPLEGTSPSLAASTGLSRSCCCPRLALRLWIMLLPGYMSANRSASDVRTCR